MWDQRYSAEDYAYGKEPNDFLRENINWLPEGKVLCLAEGEGRNAVYLAEHGYQVVAVDSSSVGLNKALKLASERKVNIDVVHADLEHFDLGQNQWNAIVSIFCHLPPELRALVHKNVIRSLKAGGILLLEAYTPRQIKLKTGGPAVAEMTMTEESLRTELSGLEIIMLEEQEREIQEGQYHHGVGAVVQFIGRKTKD